jgi:SAM-dependent methyltransferase/peptidoglycan/xylan/chitin deacetylase (PgdA/CDA1 family)
MKNLGVFTISIDVEPEWVQRDHPTQLDYHNEIKAEREVVQRTLKLFSKYGIRATWAIVSNMLPTDSNWEGEKTNLQNSKFVAGDIKRESPFQSAEIYDESLRYGRDIIEWIKNTSPKQEIGSHSFGHIAYDEARTSRDAIKADIASAKKAHKALDLPFEVFTFPYNNCGFRNLLAKAGMSVYRGMPHRWYYSIPCRSLRRLLNLLHFIIAVTPTTVKPIVDETGMVNVPGSMLFLGRWGRCRSLVSSKSLIKMGLAGLNRAVKRGEIFHLWFHPSNFVAKMDEQFYVLEAILKEAQRLKDNGQLEILAMGDIGSRVAKMDESMVVKSDVKKIRDAAIIQQEKYADFLENSYRLMKKDYFTSTLTFGRKKLQDLLEQALQDLPRGSSVLDVGCGVGEHLKLCSELGFNVIGVEPGRQMRAKAQERNPAVSVLDGVITNLPFEDESFDFVMAIEVLRYLHRSDIQQAYREMLRVLKPGGLLFFTVMNRFALHGFYIYDTLRRFLFFARHKETLHCEFSTPRQIRNDLAKLGVREVTCQGLIFAPIIIIYKIYPKLGARINRALEPFFDSLCRKKWMVPFTRLLTVIARRPADASVHSED